MQHTDSESEAVIAARRQRKGSTSTDASARSLMRFTRTGTPRIRAAVAAATRPPALVFRSADGPACWRARGPAGFWHGTSEPLTSSRPVHVPTRKRSPSFSNLSVFFFEKWPVQRTCLRISLRVRLAANWNWQPGFAS